MRWRGVSEEFERELPPHMEPHLLKLESHAPAVNDNDRRPCRRVKIALLIDQVFACPCITIGVRFSRRITRQILCKSFLVIQGQPILYVRPDQEDTEQGHSVFFALVPIAVPLSSLFPEKQQKLTGCSPLLRY